jgi:hypothetical protein
MHRIGIWLVVLATWLSATCQTSAVGASRPNHILAQEVLSSGRTTLDTTQLNEITNDLTSLRMSEDAKKYANVFATRFSREDILMRK